jgi:hypothetical protein
LVCTFHRDVNRAGWRKAEVVLVLTIKAATDEIARALVVLAMVVFLLGTPAALARATPSVGQQGSALFGGASLCGHGQTPVACHAPAGCCRPDQPIEPPRRLLLAPPAAGFITVVFASFHDRTAATGALAAFHSRAPPA